MGVIEILEVKKREDYKKSYEQCEDYKKSYEQCEKNHHDKFYNFEDISKLPLPSEPYQGMLRIQLLHMALLTAHIKVDGEKLRFGSGMVQRVRLARGSRCPMEKCRKEGKCHQWAIVTVSTVNHVVGTHEEAANTSVKLFYNKDSQKVRKKRRKIKTLKGCKVIHTDKDIGDFDWCAFDSVTHDITLARKLRGYIETLENLQKRVYDQIKDKRKEGRAMVVIVSHPHGGPKKVSVGRTVGDRETMKEVRDSQVWCRYRYDAVTCGASSGGPIFIAGQPVCGFGYWFGHPHNHAGTDGDNYSSVGVDHTL
ncbi:unnamed protein product [Lymnaea stagnalis]|uniref:Peptidase S1 domain-containing protein n=1 Tax=Lymnaea stagnalis TaxID=6523 RepID=A0AAV2HVT9_LYMST